MVSPATGSVSGLDNAGNAVEGNAVTASLTGETATSYQWLENGQVVQTGSSDSYTPTASSEIGKALDVVIGFTANGTAEQVTELAGTVNAASPTLTTTASPDVALSNTTVTLSDSAVLAGGYNETGTVTFTLYQGSTLLDTEMVSVSGNGTYSTSTGYTLPSNGTATGTYQWDATYSGDANNNTVSDNNSSAEQVTVSAASPTLVTTPSSTAVTLGTNPVTLTDTAVLAGGYHETGTVTFTLYYNGGANPVDTEIISVNRERDLQHVDRLHVARRQHGNRHLSVGRHLQRRRQQHHRQ